MEFPINLERVELRIPATGLQKAAGTPAVMVVEVAVVSEPRCFICGEDMEDPPAGFVIPTGEPVCTECLEDYGPEVREQEDAPQRKRQANRRSR